MPTPPPNSVRVLTLQLFRLGLPLLVSMSALIGLGVTDTLMVGLASTQDLAALAIGSNLSFVAIMLLIGLQSIVASRVAYRLAADDQGGIKHEAHQTLWLGTFAGFAMTVLLLCALPFIKQLGLAADVENIAQTYLKVVCWTMPLLGANLAMRNTVDGLGYTQLNMVISVLAFTVNLILDYLFVFGQWGFPALGALGCAVATCAVVVTQSLCIVWVLRMHPKIRQYQILRQFEGPHRRTLKRLSILGIPAAFAITLEEGFFSATTFLAAPMGTTQLGVHQIVLSIASVALIIPIAFGQAGAILIGGSLGAKQARVARHQAFLILGIIGLTMLLCGLVLFFARISLISLYTTDIAVITLGSIIMMFCAVQLLMDGVQIGANITLKGYQDTLVPALAQAISYWGIGFPLGFVLTQTELLGGPWGLIGIWIALLFSISCSALLNVARLGWISRVFVIQGGH